ncbi:PEP-CTERM sorting domain-containing protein [Luteolibacter flavescens]|uniref:PEP-CTERM sorting domain-containing protein n=1 Tax=Luteolibacter flavescens TaxID=1859460 RepID=A0ABT3FVF9_9BACT|nr:PEP-CTERM sorting domain-containing protein [Luteolibacter flavescens]
MLGAVASVTGLSEGAVLHGISAPGWDRSSSSAGHAAWEYWDVPSGQGAFTDLAPDISYGGAAFTSTLTQSFAGAYTTGSGGPDNNPARLGVGGEGTQFLFSLAGTGSSAIESITLQIKHSNSLNAAFEEIPSPFVASLNGATGITGIKNPNGTSTPENYRWSASDPGTSVFFWVYSYTWTGLDIAAGEHFTIDFSNAPDDLGFGFSVDTVSIDVNYAVPEPSALALLGLGGLGVAFRRRRSS